MDHLFIELAQDGAGDVTAIAAVRTDSKGLVSSAYADNVKDGDLEALCKTLEENLVDRYEEPCVVVVQSFVIRTVLPRKFLSRRPWLDISQIAWPLVYAGLIPSRDVESLLQYFRLPNTAPDTAQGNCEALVRAYWTMMRSYKYSLLAEESIRDYGSHIVHNVRSILGI